MSTPSASLSTSELSGGSYFKVPTLTGLDDFAEWKSAITDSLLMLGALDIVEGTEPLPVAAAAADGTVSVDDKTALKIWMDRNRKAMALMRRTISKGLKVDIEDCNSAKEIWRTLNDIHDLETPEYRAEIKRELATYFLLEGGDLKEHLEGFLKLLLKASEAGLKYKDDEKALMFLDTLPESFDLLKLSWRMMDNKNKTFIELRRQYNLESAQRIRTQARSTAAILLAGQRGRGGEKSSAPKARKYPAKKPGEGRDSKTKKDLSQIECFRCHKKGHYKHDCPSRGQQPKDKPLDQSSSRNEDRNGSSYLSAPDAFVGLAEGAKVTVDPAAESLMTLVSEGGVTWILDSGATHHIVSSESYLSCAKVPVSPLEFNLATRSGSMRSRAVGDVKMISNDGNQIVLKDVQFVHEARVNLLSAPTLIRRGWKLVLRQDASWIGIGGLKIPLVEFGGLFHLKLQLEGNRNGQQHGQSLAVMPGRRMKDSLASWHARLGHLSHTTIKNLGRNDVIEGLEVSEEKVNPFCDVCQRAKSHLLTFGDTSLRGERELEVLYSDVAGPFQRSASGHRYFVTLTCGWSGIFLAQAIPAKSAVVAQLIRWILALEKALDVEVRILRTDRGGEYMNRELESWMERKGIIHQPTPSYTPQHNGVSERKNRTVKEMMAAMLIESGISMAYWDWALSYSTIILLSITIRDKKSVWERLFQRKVDVSFLRPFGADAWVHIPAELRSKDDISTSNPKAWKGRYLGLTFGSGGGAVLHEETGKVQISRNITFDPRTLEPVTHATPEPERDEPSPGARSEPTLVEMDQAEETTEEVSEVVGEDEPNDQDLVDAPEPGPPEDSVAAQADPPQPAPSRVRSREGPTRILPDRRAAGRSRQQDGQAHAAVAHEDEPDPLTYEAAMRSPNAAQWQAAIDAELGNHARAGTWEEATLPPGRRAVSCKWVFKTKKDAEGNVVKHKARVVARGFSQQPGVDYQETHAPTSRMASLRTFVALAIWTAMRIHQMDVEAAFLNAEMDVELYMSVPKGLEVKTRTDSLRMRRALYGYKQSSRLWWLNFDKEARSLGFRPVQGESCIYIRTRARETVMLLLYVDDILIASASTRAIEETKRQLEAAWSMTDLGEARWILGISITYDDHGAHLSQSSYVSSVLQRFPLAHNRDVHTPMDPTFQPLDEDSALVDQGTYQALVGSLMWLAVATRPDISFAVGVLGRANAQPRRSDMDAGMRVLAYLRTTKELGIRVSNSSSSKSEAVLEGWADSDWAGDKRDRKSTSGYVFKVFGTPVSWASLKQSSVALSSVHAEYIALCEATRDAAWLLQLLDGLDVAGVRPVPLRTDNNGALTLTQHAAFHKRSKHIEVQWHYVREAQRNGMICVSRVTSADNTADILTKALGRVLHQRHAQGLGLTRVRDPSPHHSVPGPIDQGGPGSANPGHHCRTAPSHDKNRLDPVDQGGPSFADPGHHCRAAPKQSEASLASPAPSVMEGDGGDGEAAAATSRHHVGGSRWRQGGDRGGGRGGRGGGSRW